MDVTTIVVPPPEPMPEPEPEAPTIVVVEAPTPPTDNSAVDLGVRLLDRIGLLEQRITDLEAELFGTRRESEREPEPEVEPVPPAVEGETVVEPTPEIEERKEKPGKLGGGWLI